MVARDHLDPDAGVGAGPDRLDRLLPGWIDQPQQPQQGQAAGDVAELQMLAIRRYVEGGHRQHPLPLPRHLRDPGGPGGGVYRCVASRTPLGRLAEPEEIAESCCFLLSEAAAMINGIVLRVDGGWVANGYTTTA